MRPLLLFSSLLAACSQAGDGVGFNGDGGGSDGGGSDGSGSDGGDSGGGDGGDSDGGAPSADVVVNEILASNDAAVIDEAGDFEDYIELYNAGALAADISGWGLADDPEAEPWLLPEGTRLAPGAFLVLWCDDEVEEGPLHTDFKLSGEGETLVLWDASGEEQWRLGYGAQETDVSFGRIPDGGEDWQRLDTPSPGAGND